MFKSLFRKAALRPTTLRPRVPDDVRVYAIGDIHGCLTEFEALLTRIDTDHAKRSPKNQIIILLGDLIDRGPDSAGVVERARSLTLDKSRCVRCLAGNHEEMFLQACDGDEKSLRLFATNGGRETALSYGIGASSYNDASFEELASLLAQSVSPLHREFMAALEEYIVLGDYAFVHAGIRPGVPLSEQSGQDLRWIRDRFLNSRDMHERFIVHGHTITEEIDEQPNRLGIDTGAYATGKLSAVALEGDRRWFLQT